MLQVFCNGVITWTDDIVAAFVTSRAFSAAPVQSVRDSLAAVSGTLTSACKYAVSSVLILVAADGPLQTCASSLATGEAVTPGDESGLERTFQRDQLYDLTVVVLRCDEFRLAPVVHSVEDPRMNRWSVLLISLGVLVIGLVVFLLAAARRQSMKELGTVSSRWIAEHVGKPS
jgi:hypothetical protein